ncbi:hypothetical protein HK096_007629, partial [Nowakowskiella sp. JEL0078]
MPLLGLPFPVWILIARSYGNAQVISLLEELQSSKRDYQDEEGVDEFDLAPPPTQNIITDW